MVRFANFLPTSMPNSSSDDPSRPRSQRQRAATPEPADPPEWHSFLHLGLTSRESEVLWWITKGKRDREIATILGLSPRTIHRHVSSILEKLGVENRSGAIVVALQPVGPIKSSAHKIP